MTRDDFIKKYKVGDKIRAYHWGDGLWLEIIFIGSQKFFAKNDLGTENTWSFDAIDWLPYTEPPKPKKTVKMARALAQNNNGRFYVSDFIYSSKEEARCFLGKLIQWPVVINGEEQWIEVEVEE
jgi:hypothetical protein